MDLPVAQVSQKVAASEAGAETGSCKSFFKGTGADSEKPNCHMVPDTLLSAPSPRFPFLKKLGGNDWD